MSHHPPEFLTIGNRSATVTSDDTIEPQKFPTPCYVGSNSKCELCGEKFGPCPCVLTLFFTTQPVIMLN